MQAIIYKDLCSTKKSLMYSGAVMIIMSAFYVYRGMLFLPLLFFVIFPIMFLGLVYAMDELCKFEIFALATPISRKKLVLSRYLSSWLIAGISALLMFIFLLFSDYSLEIKFFIMALGAVLPSLMTSLFIPIIIKFGSAKGRLFMGVLTGLASVVFASFTAGAGGNLVPMFEKIRNLPIRILSLIIVLGVILINAISYYISTRIMEKKEF